MPMNVAIVVYGWNTPTGKALHKFCVAYPNLLYQPWDIRTIIDKDPPQTEAMEEDPFDSVISETTRTV